MKLDSIKGHGVKGGQFDVKLAPVTILVGDNGIGKT